MAILDGAGTARYASLLHFPILWPRWMIVPHLWGTVGVVEEQVADTEQQEQPELQNQREQRIVQQEQYQHHCSEEQLVSQSTESEMGTIRVHWLDDSVVRIDGGYMCVSPIEGKHPVVPQPFQMRGGKRRGHFCMSL